MASTLDITRYLALTEELNKERARVQDLIKPFFLDFYDFLADQVSDESISHEFLRVVSRRLAVNQPYFLSVFDYTPSMFSFQGFEDSEKGRFFLMENIRAIEGMGFLPMPEAFVENPDKWKTNLLAEVESARI